MICRYNLLLRLFTHLGLVTEKRKRAVLESSDEEDEYDEDDDFIDDGDDGGMDVSAEIRNLFGYDKRKLVFLSISSLLFALSEKINGGLLK